jgi:hypothetical protein
MPLDDAGWHRLERREELVRRHRVDPGKRVWPKPGGAKQYPSAPTEGFDRHAAATQRERLRALEGEVPLRALHDLPAREHPGVAHAA